MSGVKGGQTVMVTGRIGLGKDEDGGLGGGSYGGGGGDGQGGDGDGLNMWGILRGDDQGEGDH